MDSRKQATGEDSKARDRSEAFLGASSPPNDGSSVPGSGRQPAAQREQRGEKDGSGPSDSRKGPGRRRAQTGDTVSSRIRRRNRMITSCLECRRRKMKCDRHQPCSNCSKFSRECVFLAPVTDAASRLKLAELKEKVSYLEKSLEQEATAKDTGTSTESGIEVSGNTLMLDDDDDDDDDDSHGLGSEKDRGAYYNAPETQAAASDDDKDLKPTELAVQDAAYEDEGDSDADDLGFKVGKMTITDRLGGLFRPRLADELSMALVKLSIRNGTNDAAQAALQKPPRLRELLPESEVESGRTYISPHSDLVFGGVQPPYSLADFLPSRVAADTLLERFWEGVHPIAKVVHRPTLEQQYREFWSDISKGLEPSFSLQALIFSVLFAASTSMSESTTLNSFGAAQKELIENFQLATETSLSKAKFLKTSKVQTLQAFVIYMIPLCRSDISRTQSVLCGMAIRLAECLGLHRDPKEYEMKPIESHVRRMVWYQLCFLDLRTSETQGPRQTIRPGDFSTQFPVNVDDADLLTSPAGGLSDRKEWTDMTFTLLRFELNELLRTVYRDRTLLEKESGRLTHVVGKIEACRKDIYAKYAPMIHVSNPTPLQHAARILMPLYICKAFIGLLHPYLLGVEVRIPDRLRQVILSNGTRLLELAIELETAEDLKPWSWYAGTYTQYQVAFLLLMEVYIYPMRREADRIWRCVDYVFELPSTPSLSDTSVLSRDEIVAHRATKGTFIIQQIRDRMVALNEKRKMKPSVKMNRIPLPKTAAEAGMIPLDGLPTQSPAMEGNSKQREHIPTTAAPPATSGHASISQTRNQPAAASHSSQVPFQQPPQQPKQHLPQGNRQPSAHGYQDYSNNQPAFYSKDQPFGYTTSFEPEDPVTYSTGHQTAFSAPENPGTGGWTGFNAGTYPFASDVDQQAGGTGLFPQGDNAAASFNQVPPWQAESQDIPMLDIDWAEWDKLFPPETNTGQLNLSPPADTRPNMTGVPPTAQFQASSSGAIPSNSNNAPPFYTTSDWASTSQQQFQP